jgi:hypothetical protein
MPLNQLLRWNGANRQPIASPAAWPAAPGRAIDRLQIWNGADASTYIQLARAFRTHHGGPNWPIVVVDNGTDGLDGVAQPAGEIQGEGNWREFWFNGNSNNAGRTNMRVQVFDALDRYADPAQRGHRRFSVVAFICHGYTNRLQVGITEAHLPQLAAKLAVMCREDLVIPLYACSAARGNNNGDESFAAELRDALVDAGLVHCRVDGHTEAGHATNLPFVRRFEGRGGAGRDQPGEWLVEPRTPRWNLWRQVLTQQGPGAQGGAAYDRYLRWEFPFLSIPAIHRKLDRLQQQVDAI